MKRVLIMLLACWTVAAGCKSKAPGDYSYRPPTEAEEGLPVGSLADADMDTGEIEEAVNRILAGDYREVHSFLIYRRGQLVLEEYFPGHEYAWDRPGFRGPWRDWGIESSHNTGSVGKSVVSACIGIAIDLGFIGSAEDSIFEYLPNHGHLNTGGKDRIQIEHLLTMTAGLEWDEWGSSYGDLENDLVRLWVDCEDPVECILERPLVDGPGEALVYNTGNTIVLGEIIRGATGLDIDSFAGEHLFGPLGMDPPEWPMIGDSGVIYTGNLPLTPREMLRFGITYLNDGAWADTQVISRDWVNLSANPYDGPSSTWNNSFFRVIPPGDSIRGRRGYSHGWWTHVFPDSGREVPAYWAFGWGGQMIAVFPDQDAVVVFTGGTYTAAPDTSLILARHVVPAFN